MFSEASIMALVDKFKRIMTIVSPVLAALGFGPVGRIIVLTVMGLLALFNL